MGSSLEAYPTGSPTGQRGQRSLSRTEKEPDRALVRTADNTPPGRWHPNVGDGGFDHQEWERARSHEESSRAASGKWARPRASMKPIQRSAVPPQ
jgi:hypothetical protein